MYAFQNMYVLEGTARYAGFPSSSCGGLWPSAKALLAFGHAFLGPLGKKLWVKKIWRNSRWHWMKSNLTLEEIQFYFGRNSIWYWKKYNLILEEIQFDIGRNPIWHWNKSNLTLEEIQFYTGRNPIWH